MPVHYSKIKQQSSGSLKAEFIPEWREHSFLSIYRGKVRIIHVFKRSHKKRTRGIKQFRKKCTNRRGIDTYS